MHYAVLTAHTPAKRCLVNAEIAVYFYKSAILPIHAAAKDLFLDTAANSMIVCLAMQSHVSLTPVPSHRTATDRCTKFVSTRHSTWVLLF
jgi:hypothetical protein